jgi:hypothetical protein
MNVVLKHCASQYPVPYCAPAGLRSSLREPEASISDR